jgi:hypothetical protein
VVATTDILVCGSGVGAKKTDDAEKKGVEVWIEEHFTSARNAELLLRQRQLRRLPKSQAKGKKKAVAAPVEKEDQPAAKIGKEVPACTSPAPPRRRRRRRRSGSRCFVIICPAAKKVKMADA